MCKQVTMVNIKVDIWTLFDDIYNIIPITEAYELVQSLLASEPLLYLPRVTSTLVGVVNPLQFYVPVTFKTLQINTV